MFVDVHNPFHPSSYPPPHQTKKHTHTHKKPTDFLPPTTPPQKIHTHNTHTDLVDDYYLNLLSWGRLNTLAVALGTITTTHSMDLDIILYMYV